MGASGPERGRIIMVPGLGLSHYLYLTTPERRPGWTRLFSEAGYRVYALNPSANMTSSDDEATPAGLRSWSPAQIWRRWGFGDSEGAPYANTRFPTEAIDDFLFHMPLYARGGDGTQELSALLDLVGPSVVMVHSAGGPGGFEVAQTRPGDVEALIAIEPTGCPTESEDAPRAPFLAVYGDYISSRNQGSRLDACRRTRELASAGVHPAELFDYPARGVEGNTHILMQDDNAETIAADILGWLESL